MKDSEEKLAIRIVFGAVILLFSLALAYFTANYLDKFGFLEYWPVLTIAAVLYVIVGVLVSGISAVSLGFLLSADILILHNLLDNFSEFHNIYKMLLVGYVLSMLYLFAWIKFKDHNIASTGVGTGESLTQEGSPPPHN